MSICANRPNALLNVFPQVGGKRVLGAPTVYSSYKAGYVAHGRDRVFRNVKSAFVVPATDSSHGCNWRIYDQLASGSHQLDVELHPTGPDTYVAGYRIDGAFTQIPLGASTSSRSVPSPKAGRATLRASRPT